MKDYFIYQGNQTSLARAMPSAAPLNFDLIDEGEQWMEMIKAAIYRRTPITK